MLIKTKDDVEPALKTLQELLAVPTISKDQKERIEEEIRNIKAGVRGEKEAAYHIDFRLKDSKNYAIAHDLRIEHNGRVAQIDHLIVGRFFDIFLIESKNIGTAIRITGEGEFEVKTRYGWRGMASPVEQSKRHAQVLDELISDLELLPKRLGFQIRPTFHHWVLVPPECNVTRQGKEATIMKMDMFGKRMDEWIDRSAGPGVLALAKVVSRETITGFVRALSLHHRPITMNFAAKFGVTTTPAEGAAVEMPTSHRQPEEKAPVVPKGTCCENCQAPLEEKVVNFCKLNRKKFAGKLLCRKCQSSNAAPSSCDHCGTSVDEKVVAFCRFNSRKFEKKVLCRSCQVAVPQSS